MSPHRDMGACLWVPTSSTWQKEVTSHTDTHEKLIGQVQLILGGGLIQQKWIRRNSRILLAQSRTERFSIMHEWAQHFLRLPTQKTGQQPAFSSMHLNISPRVLGPLRALVHTHLGRGGMSSELTLVLPG